MVSSKQQANDGSPGVTEYSRGIAPISEQNEKTGQDRSRPASTLLLTVPPLTAYSRTSHHHRLSGVVAAWTAATASPVRTAAR